MNEPKQMCLIL